MLDPDMDPYQMNTVPKPWSLSTYETKANVFVPIYLSLELLQGLLQSVQLQLLLRCGGAAVLQPLLQLFHLYTEYIKRFLKRTRYIKLLSNIFSVEGEKNNVADPK
jgi:hypothetical protein